MLIQAHWQSFKFNKFYLMSQFEVDDSLPASEFNQQVINSLEEAQKDSPVPDDCIWAWMTEDSPRFIWREA